MSKNSIPSLINGSAGVPKVATAGKECLCRGCGASISKGEKCFDIPNPRSFVLEFKTVLSDLL